MPPLSPELLPEVLTLTLPLPLTTLILPLTTLATTDPTYNPKVATLVEADAATVKATKLKLAEARI